MIRYGKKRCGPILAVVLLLVTTLVIGCREQEASKSRPAPQKESSSPEEVLSEGVPEGDYWLNVKVDQFQGSYTFLCNGFPVERMWVNVTETRDEWMAEMQSALVGKGNVASIRIRPYLQHSGKQLTIGTVQLQAWVEVEETRESYVPLHEIKGAVGEGRLRAAEVDSAYEQWKKRAGKRWKKLLQTEPTPREAYGELRNWRWEHPIEVHTSPFRNRHGPDFSQIFEEAPVIDDTPDTRERLKDYAMHLRAVISNHDGPGLYQEIRPAKNAEYRKLGRTPPPDSVRRADWAAAAEKRVGWFQPGRSAGATSRDEIGLRQWVGGRVWELYKKDSGEPLFGESEIFVAEIDGELKVVRVG